MMEEPLRVVTNTEHTIILLPDPVSLNLNLVLLDLVGQADGCVCAQDGQESRLWPLGDCGISRCFVVHTSVLGRQRRGERAKCGH